MRRKVGRQMACGQWGKSFTTGSMERERKVKTDRESKTRGRGEGEKGASTSLLTTAISRENKDLNRGGEGNRNREKNFRTDRFRP